MTLHLIDRVTGEAREASPGSAVLGRYLVQPEGNLPLFLNSVPVREPAYFVPDLRGQWQLLAAGGERLQGAIPRSQLLDDLDIKSIVDVGSSVRRVIQEGGTWLDLLSVSPLVPGLSERADLQEFELLLADQLGHLTEVCQRPRTHLRIDVERTAVSRARRLATQAAGYLASHTEDWDRPTLRAVIPKRVLALVREEQFDIYENRVAVRLVDHLDAYLSRRVSEVAKLVRLFSEAEDYSSSASLGSHWRQKRVFQLWGASLDAGEARRKAERTLEKLKFLKYSVAGLMDSTLYKEVPRRAFVSTTLKMTNILANDVHYRRVSELWLAWARLGLEQTPRPEEYFQAMQDLCRGFDLFALLLVIRALEQLQLEPEDLEESLERGKVSLIGQGGRAELSWSETEGTLRLDVPGARPVRFVPIAASMGRLGEDALRSVIADADLAASHGEQVVLLHPSLSTDHSGEDAFRQLRSRLHALPHEVACQGRERAGFLSVSPWDLSSVERVARELRWVITGSKFLAYPPELGESPLPGVCDGAPWLEVSGGNVLIRRAPQPQEQLNLPQRLAAEQARLATLRADHVAVSEQLHLAVRDRGPSGQFNAKKKELKALITKSEESIRKLQVFAEKLEQGIGMVNALLTCPTCGVACDSRRDFTLGQGRRFSCQCPSCSTSWGTEICPTCKAWMPTLLPSVKNLEELGSQPGWVDRYLGADVLAVPWFDGNGVRGFICHVCGHGDLGHEAETP
ncbi:MAG: hypothetical protein KA711_05955 [Ideonella sp. WA131b]|jgi:hypothetical protein|nr:hypothetical protein [Ideonella sp. WA131b]